MFSFSHVHGLMDWLAPHLSISVQEKQGHPWRVSHFESSSRQNKRRTDFPLCSSSFFSTCPFVSSDSTIFRTFVAGCSNCLANSERRRPRLPASLRRAIALDSISSFRKRFGWIKSLPSNKWKKKREGRYKSPFLMIRVELRDLVFQRVLCNDFVQ